MNLLYLPLTNENYSTSSGLLSEAFVSKTVNQVSYNCVSEASFFKLDGFLLCDDKTNELSGWVVYLLDE